jgi:hypothetical protein
MQLTSNALTIAQKDWGTLGVIAKKSVVTMIALILTHMEQTHSQGYFIYLRLIISVLMIAQEDWDTLGVIAEKYAVINTKNLKS